MELGGIAITATAGVGAPSTLVSNKNESGASTTATALLTVFTDDV